MRLSHPFALVLTLILSPCSAPAEDIAGAVRSYDQAGRTLTLKPDGTSRRLLDLRSAGWRFIAFGLLAPNLFAAFGIVAALAYSRLIGQTFDLGTYVLFAVLCGSASYIAVPAIQRLAIPEASSTLPLAASLGLTFSYNVTIGIPIDIEIAKAALRAFPV